ARKIDEVVRGILDKAYQRTTEILTKHLPELHVMADTLLQYETIDAHQIDDIMAGRTPGPPADWGKTGTKPGPLPPPKDGANTPGTIGGAAEQT
ncbi:MAG TPA: ATP-dependent metalloprotease, partial [Lysobacter sp.]|nr:ATP-dependent metalloprotease [Lysobacter sp.]